MESVDRRRLSPEDNNFKRRMKTPVQLEALERVFTEDRYPSETVRTELSSLLNLSDKQLSMWFCHRRLKDRKEKDEESSPSGVANLNANNTNVSRKKPRTEKQQHQQQPQQYAVLASEPGDTAMAADQYAEECLYENAERFTAEEPKGRSRKSGPRRTPGVASKVAKAEAAAIAAVEAQLGEPLRMDGPPLGVEFDPLPPGAFSTPHAEELPAELPTPAMEQEHFQPERVYEVPELLQNNRMPPPSAPLGLPFTHSNLGGSKRKSMGPPSTHHHPHSLHYEPRPVREYQFLPELPEPRLEEPPPYFERPTPLNLFPTPDRTLELLQQSRMEEARLQKEVELQEKRIRKEFEKQEVQRRKREEQIRKEQDRLELQRKKEEERIRRDMLKEQERIEREQKKEAERLEKENKRMEKQRRREEARKEKQAAKMKAANERALAKRLAKEITDLMDDEELERMEAAAAASSLNLAFFAPFGKNEMDTTLQVELKTFPPPTVRMKPVVAIQPWSNSDQNVGNLLLVWRFLTTFADVVGLWPFTLDELVQAFHDYDSRLLGEIHVALLRTLVRDIEDAAQAVSGGMVGQRDAIAMAAGGHPQLVEAAFAWGFDIREWARHVNPLTWPEILRQFALAAGFGPKWKTRKTTAPDRPKVTPTEGEDGEDIVANLRSGAAAANAVASMQGRGMGHLRRSQYRLTPGTVKYAAFHVLSLAGDKGLNIVEVAGRIQTSGLRDLSSSRTPEASIAAALSRDTVLFERTAPSTYCVRLQFRKDSEDAVEILSAAKERIRLFRSGLVDGEEEADKDGDEADREEYESEGQDVDNVEEMEEDLEDGVVDPSEKKAAAAKTKDVKVESDSKEIENVILSQQKEHLLGPETSKGTDTRGPKPNAVSVPGNNIEEEDDKDEEEEEEEEHDMVKGDDLQEDQQKPGVQLEEETEIDESQVGEPWVQGLVEGEYADLSVEERLNALVALVTVVNEGNAIRIALEERLEAATALKRQMWAEMQLEKRRHKEELLSRSYFPPLKPDGKSPDQENMASGTTASFYDQGSLDMNVPNTDAGEAFTGIGKALLTTGLSNNGVIAEAGPSVGGGNHLAEKSRAQAKADIGLRAEELYVFRSQPLGSDRRHNRYWQFVTGNGGQDPGCGRLFFESNSDGYWGVIDTEEAFDALLASLDPRGAREAALAAILDRLEGILRQGMKAHALPVTALEKRPALKGMEESPASSILGSESDAPESVVSAIAVELGRSSREQKQALDRYRATEKWIWAECSTSGSVPKATRAGQQREARVLLVCDLCHDLYTSKDKHCQYCHATFDKSASSPRLFLEHTKDCEEKKRRGDPNWKLQGPLVSMPSRLQFLKIETIIIESCVPAKALKKEWTDQQRKVWAASLKSMSEPNQVLQALTSLESMIERDWLSSTYETTEEIASAAAGAGSSLGSQFGAVPFWVPLTTAAVALRIRLLDNAIAYSQEAKEEREKQEIEDEINQKNSKMSTFRFTPEGLPGDQDDEQQQSAAAEMLEAAPSTSGKGRSRVRSGGGGGKTTTHGGRGNQQQQQADTGPGGSCRKTTGLGSKSRVRSSSSSAAAKNTKGLKRKLQFRDGGGKDDASDPKQVWGGTAKGRSARTRGAKAATTTTTIRRPKPGPGPGLRRPSPCIRRTGARRLPPKQRNTNELMVPRIRSLQKNSAAAADDNDDINDTMVKAAVVAVAVVAKEVKEEEEDEDEEMEDESNGGDNLQARYVDEAYDNDGDPYEDENGDADTQNESDVQGEERVEDEAEEEQVEEDEEGEEGDDDNDNEDNDGDEELEEDGRDAENDAEDDAEEEAVEEAEEEEAAGEETEDEDDLEMERPSYSEEED